MSVRSLHLLQWTVGGLPKISTALPLWTPGDQTQQRLASLRDVRCHRSGRLRPILRRWQVRRTGEPKRVTTKQQTAVKLYKAGFGIREASKRSAISKNGLRNLLIRLGDYNPALSEFRRNLRWQRNRIEAAERRASLPLKPKRKPLTSEQKRVRANESAKRQYQKRQNDPCYRLKRALRCRIWKVLGGGYKSAPTMTMTGCSVEQLRAWLESKFKFGMTWENRGHVWHIDHIVPCSAFDLSKPEQQRLCFHYTNLQPLYARVNLQKHDRIQTHQPELPMPLPPPPVKNFFNIPPPRFLAER